MTGMRGDTALGWPRKPFIPKYPSPRINNQNQQFHWQTHTRPGAGADAGCSREKNALEFPINLPAVFEKVREYPKRNHWKETTPTHIMDRYIMLSAFFRRSSPE